MGKLAGAAFRLPLCRLSAAHRRRLTAVLPPRGCAGCTAAPREEPGGIGRFTPLLVSPHMSVAVNVAFKALADMARMLGDDYDVEVVETHHRFKKDAPSGTALRMAEVVAQALGRDLASAAVYDRHGKVAERSRKEIGMPAPRSGRVVGEPTGCD